MDARNSKSATTFMHWDRPITKKLLGDTTVAARWIPFALSRVRLFLDSGQHSFSKNYDVGEAFIRIWNDPANVYVTIEGRGGQYYFWVTNGSTTVLASYSGGSRYKWKRHDSVVIVDPAENIMTGAVGPAGVCVVFTDRALEFNPDGSRPMHWQRFDESSGSLTTVITLPSSFSANYPFLFTYGLTQGNIFVDWIARPGIGPPTPGPGVFNVSDGSSTVVNSPLIYSSLPETGVDWSRGHNGRLFYWNLNGTNQYSVSDDDGSLWTNFNIPGVAPDVVVRYLFFVKGKVVPSVDPDGDPEFDMFLGAIAADTGGAWRAIRIWKSVNNGDTWLLNFEHVEFPGASQWVLRYGMRSGDNIVFGHDAFVLSSQDYGVSWQVRATASAHTGMQFIVFGGGVTSLGLDHSNPTALHTNKFLVPYAASNIAEPNFLGVFECRPTGFVKVAELEDSEFPDIWKPARFTPTCRAGYHPFIHGGYK